MAASIEELCSVLGVQEGKLRYLARRREQLYRKSLVKKRSGGTRKLLVPSYELKLVQRKILDTILLPAFNRLPKCVMGGRLGISNKGNALAHVNCESMARFDFNDFFTSIDSKKVFYVFHYDLGLTVEAAKLLTSLTTISSHDSESSFLPQGSPASPVLATLAIKKLIVELDNLCKERNLVFTIWIDDITISGKEADLKRAYRSVVALLRNSRVPLNIQKTTGVIKPGSAHKFMVSGINIDRGHLSVPRNLRNRVKSGLRSGKSSRKTIAQLNYVKSVNRTQASHIKKAQTNC